MTAQKYEDQHNVLMAEWQSKFEFKNRGEVGQFVSDGIVDFKNYKNIMYILKDANNGDGNYTDRGICDEVIASNSSGKTWFNPTRWTQILLYGTSYEAVKTVTHDIQHEQLRKIAIINLKKASGKGNVADKEIFQVASKQEEYIKKQIKLCSPKLIIACGKVVFESLYNIYSQNGNIDFIEITGVSNYGGRAFDIGCELNKPEQIYVIEYRHPANGCSIFKSCGDMYLIRHALLKQKDTLYFSKA